MTVAFPSCASFQQSLDNVWFEIAMCRMRGWDLASNEENRCGLVQRSKWKWKQ